MASFPGAAKKKAPPREGARTKSIQHFARTARPANRFFKEEHRNMTEKGNPERIKSLKACISQAQHAMRALLPDDIRAIVASW